MTPEPSYSAPRVDRNCLSYWFPPIEAAGLPAPRTIIVHTGADLVDLLDGKTPAGWDDLIARLLVAGDLVGWPCFLRTGHGSGKHEWKDTCHVEHADVMPSHVARLVEWSHTVDIMGLPTSTWVVREMLDTAPLFRCEGYGGFPVTREVRVFVRDEAVEHVQPYWPSSAVEQGEPDAPDWRTLLTEASGLTLTERRLIGLLAQRAVRALGGGHWSVDLLQDRHGKWWVTDLAEGHRSFRYDPDLPEEPAA